MARSLLVRHRDHDPPPEFVARLVALLEAAIARLFWWSVGVLPVALASRLGGGVMAALGPSMPKQRHVLANLARVAPEASPEELEDLSRGVWRNIGSVLAEYPHLGRIAASRIEVRFDPGVRALVESGGPLVFCAGHLANWEIAAAQIVALGVPLTAVYTRIPNPHTDAILDGYRRQLGCRLVEKRDSARELVAALRRGEAVGLVADQRTDDGEAVPFFDAPAATATTPARLALRFDAPMIPVRVERLPHARFRVHFLAPVAARAELGDPRAQARAMTAAFMGHLEDWVRAEPGAWMCTKRRWAKDRKGVREERAAS